METSMGPSANAIAVHHSCTSLIPQNPNVAFQYDGIQLIVVLFFVSVCFRFRLCLSLEHSHLVSA